jgi:hypothetical protein
MYWYLCRNLCAPPLGPNACYITRVQCGDIAYQQASRDRFTPHRYSPGLRKAWKAPPNVSKEGDESGEAGSSSTPSANLQ